MPLDAPGRFSALAVANFFVGRDLAETRSLTNMGLQKVLYFADGEYIAKHRSRLFDARIEAWQYGPVVPMVYHEFKRFGGQPIQEKATSLEVGDSLSSMRIWTPEIPASEDADADRAFLDGIWKKYGKRRAVDLMRESHRHDGPWSRVRAESGSEITPGMMFDFFSQHQP